MQAAAVNFTAARSERKKFFIWASDFRRKAVFTGERRVCMDDNDIIRLYWDRDDRAIRATAEKYGHYCGSIARNILNNEQDAEECVNDTYLRAWNAMPDRWPEHLPPFLGRITRNLSFNRYRRGRAEKRGGGEMALVLEELAGCVSGPDSAEETLDRQELVRAVNAFVRGLPAEKRRMFIRRYWYADSVADIAGDRGVPQGTVSKALERMRKRLRAYLTERGFEI